MSQQGAELHGLEPAERAERSFPPDDVLKVIHDEHRDALLGFARRLVAGDHQRAEDVVQETLLRAWRNAHELDRNRPSLRPWLFTVARRVVIDAHRRQSARPREIDGAALEPLADADGVDQMLSSLTVSGALASLTQPHREMLREIYFRGSKVGEAAQALGIPAGTVKSRTYYALRALRLALEERGFTGTE
jgi:RNA polymerase sigma-70 factor (ECF subfamily)